MIYHVRNFKLSEFKCPCCGHMPIATPLVFWLDVLRKTVGTPLTINSGYRCLTRNNLVGGAPSSRHRIGCAADVATPAGVGYGDFCALIKRLLPAEGWEIKIYASETYVHIAAPRGAAVSIWNGEGEMAI